MSRIGMAVGGMAFAVDGDHPGLRAIGTLDCDCDVTLHLRARPCDEPLRPTGTPAFEVDSWAAFVDGNRLQLCGKSSARTPMEFTRFELDLRSLEGDLLFHGDMARLVFAFPIDQLLAIHTLAVAGGVLTHAAALAGRSGAFLVSGPSGAGKTTLSRAAHAVGARILSDERTIVRRAPDGDGGWLLGGTPWPGEGGFADNAALPLRGIMLLEQADRDELCPVSPARALALLYRCHFPPLWDAGASERTLQHLERLVREVPAFILRNRRGPDVARMLLDRLGGPA
jgi:hypothetical protein